MCDVTLHILSETIRIGLIDNRDYLPFQALDNSSGEYYGYYVDLATTIAKTAGFDYKLIISSSQYTDLGQSVLSFLSDQCLSHSSQYAGQWGS